jgi:hypothetical protein
MCIHHGSKIGTLTYIVAAFAVFIDYRCADGRFLMSSSGMAVSNIRYDSSSVTRVNAGIRG